MRPHKDTDIFAQNPLVEANVESFQSPYSGTISSTWIDCKCHRDICTGVREAPLRNPFRTLDRCQPMRQSTKAQVTNGTAGQF